MKLVQTDPPGLAGAIRSISAKLDLQNVVTLYRKAPNGGWTKSGTGPDCPGDDYVKSMTGPQSE